MGLTRDDVKGGLQKGGAKPPAVRAPKPRPSSTPAFTPTARTAQLRAQVRNERPSTGAPAPRTPAPPKLNPFGGEVRAKGIGEFNPRERSVYKAYLDAQGLGKQPQFTRMQMQQMGLLPHIAPDYHFDAHGRPLPSNSVATRFVEGFTKTALGAPAIPYVLGKNLYEDAATVGGDAADVATGHAGRAKLPTAIAKNIVKPMALSFKDTATHPTKDPFGSLMNVAAIASMGAKFAELGAAADTGAAGARVAGDSSVKGALKGAKAAVRAKGSPIVMRVPKEGGGFEEVRLTRSNSALGRLIQRGKVARRNHDLAEFSGAPSTRAGAVRASFGSPEKSVGRLLARHNELEQQMLESNAHGLDKFHRRLGGMLHLNRSTLSDAEQKALDVTATHGREIVGNPDAVAAAVGAHTRYHVRAAELARQEIAKVDAAKQDLEEASSAGDESAMRLATRRLRRAEKEHVHGDPAGHEAQATLAGAAEQHLVQPRKALQQALEQAPRAIQIREHLLGNLEARPGEKQTVPAAASISEAKVAAPDERLFVASRDGQKVGRLLVRNVDGRWEVSNVRVLAAHQRQGVATQLYRHAEAQIGAALQHAPVEHRTPEGAAFAEAVKPGSRLSEERQLFRVGARHAELEYGSRGVETPIEELKRLYRDNEELATLRKGKTAARVEHLTRMIERLQHVRARRGGPAHAAELAALKAELDAYATKYGPHVRVLGAKRVNDAIQQASPAERRFVGEGPGGPTVGKVEAPHTLESAEAQLERMQHAHEGVLGRYLLGPDYNPAKGLRDQVKLEPAELAEHRFRNTSNGIYKKAMAALNAGERGPRGGSAALRRGYLPNVKDQKMAAAERDMHAMLEERAKQGDEFAQRFLAHHEKMINLQAAISDVREHAAFTGPVTPELLHEKLGTREIPASTPPKDMGAAIEETRPRPDHSIGKVRSAEAGSARAAGKLEQFRALDAQEAALKKELNKLVGLGRKGKGSQKAGYRLMQLATTEEGRHARISAIHDDTIAMGKVLRDKGAFYVPSRELSDVKRVSSASLSQTEYGPNDPNLKAIASVDKHYSAGYERQGVARHDVTKLVQESYREANKAATLDRGFKRLWTMSKSTRDAAGGEAFAIPIRAVPGIPEPLRRLMNRVEHRGLTAEEASAIPPHELEQLREHLFPNPKNVNTATNLTAEGVPVRWLDRRMVDGLMKRQPKGVVVGHSPFSGREVTGGDLFDAINQPIRAGLLYTKPAYALNFLQALGTITLQQGIYTPRNLHDAFALGRKMGWEDQHRIFALMGEGATHAIIDERAHWLGEAVTGAGHFWNAVVDRYPRVAAFLHEARMAGYSSQEALHGLLHDPAKRADLLELSDRANREAIDYSMSQGERTYLRRFLFFYPWIRGATLWSLRFPIEHPYQAAAYTPLAQRARADTEKALGPAPSYAEGIVKIGGRYFNLANLNTFQTLLDATSGLGAIAGGNPKNANADKLAGELGPLTGAAYTAISGKSSLGHDLPQNTSRLKGGLERLIEGQPALVFANRAFGKANEHTNVQRQSSNVQPSSSEGRLLDAAERWTAGGLVPVTPNLPALHAKAEQELVQNMGTRNAAVYRYGKAYEQADKLIEKVVAEPSPQLRHSILSAIDMQRELDLHERDYAKAKGRATTELTAEQKLGVALNVLEHAGVFDQALVNRVISGVSATDPQYRQQRADYLLREVRARAGGHVLSEWKAVLKTHGVKYAGPG